MLHAITSQTPDKPSALRADIPGDLETIILKAIQAEPKDRYPSAAALRDDLKRFQADEPIQARRISLVERCWRWCRRNPRLATATAIAIAALLTATIASIIACGCSW